MKWILIFVTVFASSGGDVLCASGMSDEKKLGDVRPTSFLRVIQFILTRRKVILGWLCYAAAFFSLLALLALVPLSVAVPATGLSFVVDTLGARFILHERVHLRRWLGVICVCAGVFLAVRPAQSARPSGAGGVPVQASQHQPGNDKSGSKRLDQKSAMAEVFAKPRRLETSNCISADEDDCVTHARDGFHHRR